MFLRLLMCLLPMCLFGVEGALEVRGGYFRFANSTAREIYGGGAPDVELEGIFFVNRYLNPWINANYIWKGGKTEALSSRTDLKMGVFSFGTKFFFPYKAAKRFYLGVGPCAGYLQIHDHSSFVPRKTVRWGGGVVGKSGLFFGNRKLFLDLFFDYYYLPIRTRSSVSENSIDLGGFRIGAGLGSFF
ncbi:MAG TPA: hypothetical protein VFU89_02770 [Rhabdochlamydiaceae bacterium]|nr:hypothetical protein [Rhabdochlamydiaceae bacterium]